jgi:MoaA/NifB/PqqE/SkfB family radical SAM enzyme
MSTPIYSFLEGKNIVIWGAGNQGTGLIRKLKQNNIKVSAIVDSNLEIHKSTPEIRGYPLYHPDELSLVRERYKPLVLIVTQFFEEDALVETAIKAGFEEGIDLLRLANVTPYIYVVDISGVCNLRCASCPRGKDRPKSPPKGFMSAETFNKLADKIVREDPLAASIQLYQWGEPLLNKDLPKIITLANDKGLASAISSNLNVKVDLEPIIEAAPKWLRASLSGFGPRYELTHNGGNFSIFFEKLLELHTLIAKHKSKTKVQLFYHLYKDNRGSDLRAARDFSRSLGFEFHPVWAYLISLDEILEYLETGKLPDEARRISDNLEIDITQAIQIAKADASKKCLVKNMIPINWDLSVSHCMMFYYRENNLACDNFMEHSLTDIVRIRKNPPICVRCKKNALHRYCEVYNNYPTDTLKLSQM